MALGLAIFVTAAMAFFLGKSRRNYLLLPDLPLVSGAADVTVIIPARNEERVIARAVASFPGQRVIVVDDASEDRTSEEAAKAGAEVIPAPPLAPGVLGKPNACRAGAAMAGSKWLLFADADTWYVPGFAASIAAYAEREALDAATAFLRQETVSAAEGIILPYAFALYFCGVNARSVNSPDARESLANGQCLLVRREAYERIGTHAAVAGSVIEDAAFARLVKSRGLRLRVLRAERLGAVRMYDGFPAIRRGFEKNSFRFLGANPLTGAQVILASVILTSWLPVLMLLAAAGHLPAAAAFALVPPVLLAPWYGSAARALGAPLAIYLFQFIALSAMVRTIAGVKTLWKGRYV
jgi:cellulose synthase/poly-beta-1,6-N-acetylglucosamine synthase-like glycosyltransferase